jgi:hypothetical protein
MVLDFGFQTKKFEENFAYTNKENRSSIKLLMKYNFILLHDKDERFPDNIVFSLKKSYF